MIDYKEYHPKWTLIRRMILRREKNRCAWCGLNNHEIITKPDRKPVGGHIWHEVQMMKRRGYSTQQAFNRFGLTRIVLTIAHIDHDHTNNRFSNLAALCQRCHLNHDAPQHASNRKYGRHHNRKHQLKLI
jgi:hypothetical protein